MTTHPPKRVQAIFFDLDNCLFDTNSMGRDLFDQYDHLVESWRLNLDEARAIKQALWNGGAPQLAIPRLGVSPEQQTELMKAYDNLQVTKGGRLYADTKPFLSKLYAQPERPRMILVTKGLNGFQRRKIQHLQIEQFFDHIQIVGDFRWSMHTEKWVAFGHLAVSLSLNHPQVVVVGDNPTDELAAGRKHNMVTVQTLRPGVTHDPQAKYHITKLDELWSVCNL